MLADEVKRTEYTVHLCNAVAVIDPVCSTDPVAVKLAIAYWEDLIGR